MLFWADDMQVDVKSSAVAGALHSFNPDFEDSVQAGCAGDCHADAIVTRDKKGFADSGIPIYTPAELLEKHTCVIFELCHSIHVRAASNDFGETWEGW